MRFKFWGTRGSIPAPGPNTVRYGGNTTCIEVCGDDGECLILDAGSGIRDLGLHLARKMPVKVSIFITHTHWDHIQGLPFFVPLFVPGNEVIIHGPPDPVGMKGIEDVLTMQMAYPNFPVRAAELLADISFKTLSDRQDIQVGSMSVSSLLMNHPAINFGFRIDSGSRSLFFTGDHEPFTNIYSPEDPEFDDYEEVVQERNQSILECLRGVDVIVSDSQYTTEEYSAKVGWGHSTYDQCLYMADAAEIPRVFFTHHETTRPDEDLEKIFDDLVKRYPHRRDCMFLAREGDDVEV